MHYKEVKGLLSARNGMNVFRGCTHGCIYCDSRSACYHIDHEFEDVEVKVNAPRLLEDALRRKRKKCVVSTGSMCDPYIPLEADIGYTRSCLEIIRRYGFGLAILTKSTGILRDLDLLKAINQQAKCVVQMTLTTFDQDLCKILEPNVATTSERFEALKIMRDNGIPTVAWLCPFLPYINDTAANAGGLMDYCVEAGVKGVMYFGPGLTLREGNRQYFYQKLDEHFPGLKSRYIKKYGNSYELWSDNAQALDHAIKSRCRQNGIMLGNPAVFEYLTKFEERGPEQLSFF